MLACRICGKDVYASCGADGAPSASSHLHARPVLPTGDTLYLSDACVSEAELCAITQSPGYERALGIQLPSATDAPGHPGPSTPLQGLAQRLSSLQLPAVPARLLDDTPETSDAPSAAETAALDSLRAEHELIQRDVAAYVQKAEKKMQSAIQSAKEKVQSRGSTEVPAKAPARPSHLGTPMPSSRRSASSDMSQVGRLSASFAKLGRVLPEAMEKRAESQAARAPAAEADRAHPPPAPKAAAPPTAPPAGAPDDSETGSIDEEAGLGDTDEPVFETDEDLARPSAGPAPAPAPPLVRDVERKPREVSDVSQKLNSGMGMSFSMLAGHGLKAAHEHLGRADRLERAYEHEQQGPYDLQRTGRPSAHAPPHVNAAEHASVRRGRYTDEELALAGVLASNIPSHRHSRTVAPDADEAPADVLARSVPSKRALWTPAPRPRRDVSDGFDREPKTSLPYKEKMMVPSLRKAIRERRAPPSPPAARHTPSRRTSGFLGTGEARAPPVPSAEPAEAPRAPPTAPREASSAPPPVPPVPYVPSASVRVSLGPESAPRALGAVLDEAPPSRTDLDKTVYYMHYVQNLKLSKRTGWFHHGVPAPESIADHMYRMAMLAMLVDPAGMDVRKCVAMALVHDLAEAQVGDLTPMCRVDKAEKTRREHAAIEYLTRDLLADSPAAQQIRALWAEYEERTTREARLVKDLDCFELCLQAYEYEQAHGVRDLQQFWQGAVPKIQHAQVRAWAQTLLRKRRALWESRGVPYDAPSEP